MSLFTGHIPTIQDEFEQRSEEFEITTRTVFAGCDEYIMDEYINLCLNVFKSQLGISEPICNESAAIEEIASLECQLLEQLQDY
jgi:hypothetical protein